MSYKTNRPEIQMFFKTIRAKMLLSYKNKGLLDREVFKIQLGKKVVLVSKSLMGKISLTGELTGLRHRKVARWQVFVVKSNETL